jgi:cytochrome c553
LTLRAHEPERRANNARCAWTSAARVLLLLCLEDLMITTRPILLAVLAAIACQPSFADDTPSTRFERDIVMRYHMHQNFDLVRAIERLLIRGKLADARQFATSISWAPDEPAHGPWATHAVTVRERAGAVARAKTVDDAIAKTAKLGAACGNCHGDLGVSTSFEQLPKLPADKPTVEARMQRHRWAADRLWEGVIGNANKSWRAGLDLLAAAPLDQPANRAAFARDLQRIAKQARQPSSGPLVDRATTYGEILVVCARCHTTP